MPWNFCLFYKGEVEVRRENEPSCKNSWIREFTAHGGWLEAGWTSAVLYRDSDGLRAQHKLFCRSGLLSDDRKEVLEKSSLSTLIITVWVSVSPLFDASHSFWWSHIISQFTSELGKHWICSQIEFINCSVCSYFKPGLANSYANQARWGWGAGVVVASCALLFQKCRGQPYRPPECCFKNTSPRAISQEVKVARLERKRETVTVCNAILYIETLKD